MTNSYRETFVRQPTWFLTAVVLGLALACSDITEPLVPSLSIVPGGGEGQSGTVGTILPLALIVQVTGLSGSTNDQILNFVVTSGGGSVFANVVQTGTPSSGPAAKLPGIGSDKWTLGPTAGAQTVEARLVDPKTGATLTQATFHATALAGSANVLKLSAGNNQVAVAGTAVGIAPAVLVTDQSGNPIPNVTVTFQVASGGGAITGGTQVATGATGVAVVAGWTLGATAGPNTLRATVTGLVGSPLTFAAAGIVGVATELVRMAGDGQHAALGSTLPVAPAVQVRDANGNGVGGVAVTFTVTAGGGTMAGITSVTTLTNQSGSASVGWSLGPAPGANTLRATALGLNGSPVIFNAISYTPLYVTNIDDYSIAVYEAETNGNAAPVRTLSGPNTGLVTPTMIVRDALGQLYVSNYTGQSLTIYAAGATGNVSPIRTMGGSNTGIDRPYGLTRDTTGQIYVANFAIRTITVYSPDAVGNASPLRTIGGGSTGLSGPTGLKVDPTGQLYVVNNSGNSITIYASDANGDAAPVRTISGPHTGLDEPVAVELDATGQLYVTNFKGQSITVYAPGSVGDATPVRTISGPSTGLVRPVAVARDGTGQLYVTNYAGQSITVYAGDATGNATPLRTISGGSTGLHGPNWLAF
jgi:6-phosphogluconolactonase (cycloisomerase 2 family)